MKWMLALSSAGMILAGCGAEQTAASRPARSRVGPSETYALDQISHNWVEIGGAIKRRYLGETYYFESQANAELFDANPWSHLYGEDNPDRSSLLKIIE